jgi:hypothetical protein
MSLHLRTISLILGHFLGLNLKFWLVHEFLVVFFSLGVGGLGIELRVLHILGKCVELYLQLLLVCS